MRHWIGGLLAALLPILPAAAQPDALVARGRQLVEGIAACGNCHTPKGPQGDVAGMAYAGGFVIDIPGAFRAVVPNITPDPETGIGRWSDAEIARAIRDGKRPDGSTIGPPMPIELYRDIADADLAAIIAYLRSVAPIRNAVGKSSYPMPLPPSYGPPVAGVAAPADDPVARGAYLAGPLGHCIECHTPMLADGRRDWSRTGAGGVPIPGPFGMVVPRNITPAALSGWSDAQVIRAITQGISADGGRLSPPMAFPYYARMSDAELRDVVAYLRALPPLR
ncbi:c-type cytochrome [Paracraurococcus ruber]|uniref:Cytochrome C n=1 Tax=Paracraurococcus ruber TaxID=77675 RepID=A0ABS1CUK0_9PROT|nr:cytochrome c [Paracraurococcus ruber]MBK1657677.1 cytochrome C [Paracraurococcus ruber]TDG31519.1 c-type cytochrome [Paracraurococcus ruber]